MMTFFYWLLADARPATLRLDFGRCCPSAAQTLRRNPPAADPMLGMQVTVGEAVAVTTTPIKHWTLATQLTR
jgi:hypothetical protein